MSVSARAGLITTGALLLVSMAPTWAGAATDHTPAGFSCQELAEGAGSGIGPLPLSMPADSARVDSLTDDSILGMDALDSDDVWAVGVEIADDDHTPLVRHFDGSVWTELPAADPETLRGATLTDVEAISADDVWAAGWASERSTSAPMLQHWDGTAWTIVETPALDGTFGSIHAVGPRNIWAVGSVREQGDLQPLAEHFDGTSWTVVDTPAVDDSYAFFNAVAGSSARDIWAVGSSGNGVASDDLTEHWDGRAWSVVDSPNPGRGSFHEDYLAGVDVDATGTVRAVGSWRSGGGGCGGLYALEWTGSVWKRMPGARTDVTNPCFFEDLTSTPAGDVWAVGSCLSRRATLVEHWDGSTWSRVASPVPGKRWGAGLDSVTAVSGTDAWAGGTYTPRWQERALFEHWDGVAWTVG